MAKTAVPEQVPEPEPPVAPKTLPQKLLGVMERVKYIQKKGFNSFHKYKYATEADVAETVREALIAEGLLIIPNVLGREAREVKTSKGNIETVTSVRIEYTIVDVATGEKLAFTMEGDGQDPGDKGIFKATTGCTKYALMKLFHIPTGDDPEADAKTDEAAAERAESAKVSLEQAEELAALCIAKGKDIGRLCDFFHAKTVSDLTVADYERAKRTLTKAAA